MPKKSVTDFETDVCMGEHEAFDEPCPHRVPVDEDTGRAVVDKLAQAEAAAINTIRRSDEIDYTDFKCGECGCPLTNLALTDKAPLECPRIAFHDQ